MLSLEVHRALTDLVKKVHEAAAAAEQRVAFEEIDLRVTAALASADRLEAITGVQAASTRRHLGWIRHRHGEGQPELSDGDVRDLRQHDLPEVIDAIGRWVQHQIDPDLLAAIEGSWEAQQYDAAVRDAFVHVEERLRSVGGIDPREGLVGRRLVNRVLPGTGPSDRWTPDGFLGAMTDQEQGGAREILHGALALFRNATAHRVTAYSREEAQDVLHLVNLCIRLIKKIQPVLAHE